MKITKRQLRRIIKEEKAKLVSERYLDSSEEKAMAKAIGTFADDTISDLEMLVDQNYGRFSSNEIETLQQALEILNNRLGV